MRILYYPYSPYLVAVASESQPDCRVERVTLYKNAFKDNLKRLLLK